MSSLREFSGKNLRILSLIFVAMFIVVLLDSTNASADGNSKNSINNVKLDSIEVYDLPAIQWACEPFLDSKQAVEANQNVQNLHHVREKTRELCVRIRGGEVKEGANTNAVVFDETNVEGIAESSNSSIEFSLVEKQKNSSETDATKSDLSSSTTSTNDSTGLDEEEQVSTPEEVQYAPSAAPTSTVPDSMSKYTFPLCQEGDGHETDPDGIPIRYLKMQNGRRDLAKTAFEKTIEWRKENEVDTILARPHSKYDVAKAVFPHYFCGRDDTQHVILLQRPGLLDIKLAHKNGVSGEDLLFHYIYVMEYLWRIIDPASDAIMTSIIDLTEMNISILRRREQLRIGSLFLSTMDAHFPQRSHRTFLINAPRWFGALYKLASPLLREGTKAKIQILSKGKEQDEVLKDLLRDCPIPEGDKYENVPSGIMEEDLRKFCVARLEEAGVSMQQIEPE